jgi:hypothetical protein
MFRDLDVAIGGYGWPQISVSGFGGSPAAAPDGRVPRTHGSPFMEAGLVLAGQQGRGQPPAAVNRRSRPVLVPTCGPGLQGAHPRPGQDVAGQGDRLPLEQSLSGGMADAPRREVSI